MNKLLATLCLSISLHAVASDEHKPPPPAPKPSCTDCWNGSDKAMHFGVSAVVGFAAVNQWPDNKPKAFAVAMIPGVLKEISDAQKGGSGFSGKDLVADALGAAFGVYAGGWLITRAQGTTKVAYATGF